MNAFLLPDLAVLRAHLARQGRLFEPQDTGKGEDKDWLMVKDVAAMPEPDARPRLPLSSAKAFFFAERERLFSFDGDRFTPILPYAEPFVLFGLRSCDLNAIAYQDRFFKRDPYYQARRGSALLVGIDCAEPCAGGFCPTVDAGPFIGDGLADLVCHAMPGQPGGGLLLALSEAGDRALQGLALEAAPMPLVALRKEREASVKARFPDDGHLRVGIERVKGGRVESALWEALGLQCLSCSGCTSLCPTCSCFTIFEHDVDTGEEAVIERERCWDSCLYEAFQREASGHNPSRSAGQRVARFWFHKFALPYVDDFGRYGCVGCGRCERACPGVIGVHSIMKRISSAT